MGSIHGLELARIQPAKKVKKTLAYHGMQQHLITKSASTQCLTNTIKYVIGKRFTLFGINRVSQNPPPQKSILSDIRVKQKVRKSPVVSSLKPSCFQSNFLSRINDFHCFSTLYGISDMSLKLCNKNYPRCAGSLYKINIQNAIPLK